MFPGAGQRLLVSLDRVQTAHVQPLRVQTPRAPVLRRHAQTLAVPAHVRWRITVALLGQQGQTKHLREAKPQGRVIQHQNPSSSGMDQARQRRISVKERRRCQEQHHPGREEHQLRGSQCPRVDALRKIGPDSPDPDNPDNLSGSIVSRVTLRHRVSRRSIARIVDRTAARLIDQTTDLIAGPAASLAKSDEIRVRLLPIGREDLRLQRRQAISGLIIMPREAADSAGNALRDSAAL